MKRDRGAGTLSFGAVIFDMDGVVTRTAQLHAAAWKALFDRFLEDYFRGEDDARARPFEVDRDYFAYVDGKPRYDGVRSFLASRDIELPEGEPSDGAGRQTVYGLGNGKDELFEARLESGGAEVFESSIRLIRELRARGVKTGLVTSSRHGRQVLGAAGISDLFDVRVDGLDTDELALPGKPDPAAFLECANRLAIAPAQTVLVEDAIAGVAAGGRGGFGLVVGVSRGRDPAALSRAGADEIVSDLRELTLPVLDRLFRARQAAIGWRVEQEGFDPAREREMESIFSIGNGYLGVRGALDLALPGSQGDLFVAGVYDRKQPAVPYSELEFINTGSRNHDDAEIASLPFPFRIRLEIGGNPVDLIHTPWREHARLLDMRQGVLHGRSVFEVGLDSRVRVNTRRCASVADLHLLVQEITVCMEDRSATIELDAAVPLDDLAADHPHLLEGSVTPPQGVHLRHFATRASGLSVCVAARSRLVGSDEDRLRWSLTARIGEPMIFRRFIVVYTSRDADDPVATALAHLNELRWEAFDTAIKLHAGRWAGIWETADIRIEDSPGTEQALRFQAYHLMSAADRDPRVSVPAKALTGRAYEGHVFWDVEIFMLPFYLHTCPEIARNLLLYRHGTLEGAKRRARATGFAGASFAWESTVSGNDVTPEAILLKTSGREIPVFTGKEQIHVTADVAYGVWRYGQATGDREFLYGPGIDILVETARFWASRSVEQVRTFHIRGVTGPDEYHHSVDDNAYTNWMARFNLEKAAEAAAGIANGDSVVWREVSDRLALQENEPDRWLDVARRLHCPQPDSSGVIEQFKGFFSLADFPLTHEERFKAPIDRLFEWQRVNRSKLIKQADVLMLLYLFPDAFPEQVLAANYHYYEPRTDHASSLSPPIHAALAARLGFQAEAERFWQQSLTLDLSNHMGNSTLGVHPGSMGGTWQALVFGFLGIRPGDEAPQADSGAAAGLPSGWKSVAVNLEWRGRRHALRVDTEAT
jgi:HAD superfamily hydrolase (TIGR01509 family)